MWSTTCVMEHVSSAPYKHSFKDPALLSLVSIMCNHMRNGACWTPNCSLDKQFPSTHLCVMKMKHCTTPLSQMWNFVNAGYSPLLNYSVYSS